MGHELRIIFEGVMALGPPHDQSHQHPGPFYAVMPRVMRHEARFTKLDPDLPPSYIPVHLPALFTTLEDQIGKRKPDDRHRDFSIWYPMRERMELRFSPFAIPSDLRYVRDTDVPEQDPLQDIAKVADFREIWPERAALLPGLRRRTAPLSYRVAAQVFVPSGRVGSHGEFEKESAARAEFLPARTPVPVVKDLLPQVIVSVITERVEIDTYSLDTGEKLDSLAFVTADAPTPSILRIANADPMNIRYVIDRLHDTEAVPPTGIKPRIAARPGDKFDWFVDIDFEACYSVLDGVDDNGGLPIPWVPVPFGERNCNTGLALPGDD